MRLEPRGTAAAVILPHDVLCSASAGELGDCCGTCMQRCVVDVQRVGSKVTAEETSGDCAGTISTTSSNSEPDDEASMPETSSSSGPSLVSILCTGAGASAGCSGTGGSSAQRVGSHSIGAHPDFVARFRTLLGGLAKARSIVVVVAHVAGFVVSILVRR
eukprot:SAG11_NODE_9074_length_947_cov_0.783019_1_plen_160_part_00